MTSPAILRLIQLYQQGFRDLDILVTVLMTYSSSRLEKDTTLLTELYDIDCDWIVGFCKHHTSTLRYVHLASTSFCCAVLHPLDALKPWRKEPFDPL